MTGLELTPEDMRLINRHTIKPLTAEEVFVFKIAICNNELDRDFEVIPLDSLHKLAELFGGKTVIMDHNHKSENQCARIYVTEVVSGEGMNIAGETVHKLLAKCYMPITKSNSDLITEISAGIKKEVSIACRMETKRCSICGKEWYTCAHQPGDTYDGKLCYFTLENPTDAYEVSFVAVPAQPGAGVVKSASTTDDEAEQKAFAEKLAEGNTMLFKAWLREINNYMKTKEYDDE